MWSVTNRTGETVSDNVIVVAGPTLVQIVQVMALGAEGVSPGRAQVRTGVQILARDRLAGSWSLRVRILALENVAVL